MARDRPSASSTKVEGSPSAAFPLAWRFERASEAMIVDLASALRVKSATRAAVAASLSDPAGVRARIANCPLLSAVALEILADVGGAATTAAVGSEIARRTGVSLAVAEKAARAAGSSIACLFTTIDAHHRGLPETMLLIDICAGPVAALVRGLTLPRPA